MYSDDSQGGEPRRPKSWEIPPGYEFDETTHAIRRITHTAKEEQKPKSSESDSQAEILKASRERLLEIEGRKLRSSRLELEKEKTDSQLDELKSRRRNHQSKKEAATQGESINAAVAMIIEMVALTPSEKATWLEAARIFRTREFEQSTNGRPLVQRFQLAYVKAVSSRK
jgi:hypothetical protein